MSWVSCAEGNQNMYKILKADKDTYITNRVIDGQRKVNANVGEAGSLDLYKIFGQTFSGSIPNVELSRLLIHFDLTEIQNLTTAGKIDVTNSSFFAKLVLFDVYGGQTTPENYRVVIDPLSASFHEGRGKDVSLYSDLDTANFLSSSTIPWISGGCSFSSSSACDFLTGFSSAQDFLFDENLSIDVTAILSATLTRQIPDEGFRIAFDQTLENDAFTYFVKRFASRHAYDPNKHPQLIIGFDDSIQDDTQRLSFDDTGVLFLYNHHAGALANLVSSSVAITGSNSLILRLETEISGGFASYNFGAGQHGQTIGIYSSSVNISSNDAVITQKLLQSSSISFIPIWSSLDGTIAYLTGSRISIWPAAASNNISSNNHFTVTTINLKNSHRNDEKVTVRTNIFDTNDPKIIAKRLPIILPSLVIRDVHYAVRDVADNLYRIDFDTVKNSTRLSSDVDGMYFRLDMTNLLPNKSYVIDILITSDDDNLYQNVSPVFTIHK